MKRAERQYALVDLLRGARRPRPAARLADEFGVSPRTIERDIASLQLAGVPIYAEHGATGGYAILRDYSLPPLNLSATESLAVLAGLALLDSSPYQAAARRARAKIAAVMEEEHREPVQKMLGMMQVIDAVAPTNDAVPLGMLSDVIADRRVVRLTYLGEDKDGGPDPSTSTVRDVETMGLLRAGDAWLLAGWCRLRDAIRGFRIERITELRILDEAPPPRDPALLEADLARWPTRRLT
ncbi:helix-turn-helix transcriptional regulator [[Kitasatospora] papulosa]|uniref:helix-turn-helix transcriptional regulator n=1 Tax=[Kitasatospora] papulosa TaxID=1464011 RepID=UPI000BDA93F1|nr:proteasome accessory factor B [Streptomyces avidinii]SNX77579.1 proteasome accessory factor B [Streptomyces microflavus]